jgi:hypothetical protein
MWSEVRPPATTQVRDAFGVEVGELRPCPGGFEADAFTDGRWFLKLWRRQPDSDAGLALTAEPAARGIPVPAAERALDGSYTSEHDGRRYALFPFVGGRQGTWDDADAIARAMRAVHEVSDLALPRTDMDEWCIEVLRDRHDHPWIADRRDEGISTGCAGWTPISNSPGLFAIAEVTSMRRSATGRRVSAGCADRSRNRQGAPAPSRTASRPPRAPERRPPRRDRP